MEEEKTVEKCKMRGKIHEDSEKGSQMDVELEGEAESCAPYVGIKKKEKTED